jgi:hypothetical protein
VDGAPAPPSRAARARAGGIALCALLALAGSVLGKAPVAMAGFAGLALLGWGRALGMVGLFGLAVAIAAHATRKPAAPTDELTPWIGPPAAQAAPTPPEGGS